MREGVAHGFRTGDVPMIEAQQHFLGDTDLLGREFAMLKSAAAIRVQRYLARLIGQEAGASAAQVAAE